MKKLSSNHSNILLFDEPLYGQIMRILEAKEMSEKALCLDSKINRQILSDIKLKKTRPSLKIVISICVGLQLLPDQAIRLIETAGYKLNDNYPMDRAYLVIINSCTGKTIKQCNELLRKIENEDEELVLKDSDLLGSRKNKKEGI